MAIQYYYDNTYKTYAYRENHHKLVVTQGEGYVDELDNDDLIKAPRFQLLDERGEIIPPDGSLVQLALKRPNGSETLVDCVIEQVSNTNTSYIKIPIHKSITAYPGEAQGEIRLITANAVIKFYGVNFIIYNGVSDQAAEQSENFPALIRALQKVVQIVPAGDLSLLTMDEVIEHTGQNPVASGIIYDYLVNNYVPLTREIAGIPLDDDIGADDLREAISSPKVTVGTVAPTKQTAGNIGDFYIVRLNPSTSNWIYQCKAINDNNGSSEYLWVKMVQSSDIDNFVSKTLTIAGIQLNNNIGKEQLAVALEGYSLFTIESSSAPVLTSNSSRYPIPTLWRQISNGEIQHLYLLTSRTGSNNSYIYTSIELPFQENTSKTIRWDESTSAANNYVVPNTYEGRVGDCVIVVKGDKETLWQLQSVILDKDYYVYSWHKVTNQDEVDGVKNYADSLFASVHTPDIYAGLTDKPDSEYVSSKTLYYVGDYYVNSKNGKIWKCVSIEFDSSQDASELPPWEVTWDEIDNIYHYPASFNYTILPSYWSNNQFKLSQQFGSMVQGRNKADVDIDATTYNQLIHDGCFGIYISSDDSGTYPEFTVHALGNVPTETITIQITFSHLVSLQ